MKTKWVSKHWLFVTCSYFFTHLCCFFPHSSSSSPCFASCSLRVSLEPAGGVGVFQIWWAPVVWALELIEKGSRNPWNPYNRNYQEPQVPHPQTWIYIYIYLLHYLLEKNQAFGIHLLSFIWSLGCLAMSMICLRWSQVWAQGIHLTGANMMQADGVSQSDMFMNFDCINPYKCVQTCKGRGKRITMNKYMMVSHMWQKHCSCQGRKRVNLNEWALKQWMTVMLQPVMMNAALLGEHWGKLHRTAIKSHQDIKS